MKQLSNAARPIFESALEHLETSVQRHGFNMEENKKLSFIVLRGKQYNTNFIRAIKNMECTLPDPLKFTTNDHHLLLWISPDEWLIVCEAADKQTIIDDYNKSLKKVFSAIIDNSGSYTHITIGGTHYLDILSKITPYDFTLDNFAIGDVLSTQFAKAPVVVYRSDDSHLNIMVRFSFADYFWRLFEKASQEYS